MCAIYFMGPRIFGKLEKKGGALGDFMDQVDGDADEEFGNQQEQEADGARFYEKEKEQAWGDYDAFQELRLWSCELRNMTRQRMNPGRLPRTPSVSVDDSVGADHRQSTPGSIGIVFHLGLVRSGRVTTPRPLHPHNLRIPNY